MAMRDKETGNNLRPSYICITCSASYNEGHRADFDSNSLAARINVDTFENCWASVLNKNLALSRDNWRDKLSIPKEDNDALDSTYLVWAIVKDISNYDAQVNYQDNTLGRNLIGLISESDLKRCLPKTAKDVLLQKVHFGLK